MNRELQAAREAYRRAGLDYQNQEARVKAAHSTAQRSLDESHLTMIAHRREEAKRELDRLEDAVDAQERQVAAVRDATERQLAAQRESAERQEAIARASAADQLNAARVVAQQQAAHEERTFWFRRFFTTLGIAHAGAFFAMATGLAQADDPEKIAPYLATPFTSFATGMVFSGLIPLCLMAASGPNSNRPGHHLGLVVNYIGALLAAGAAFAFVLGLGQLVGFFRGFAAH